MAYISVCKISGIIEGAVIAQKLAKKDDFVATYSLQDVYIGVFDPLQALYTWQTLLLLLLPTDGTGLTFWVFLLF